MVERGQFRLDLFHRLSGLALTLPPLRDRDDKQKLIEALLDAEAREQGAASARLTPEALDLMLAYAWPGNIRELRSVLRTALALSDGGVIDVGTCARAWIPTRPPSRAVFGRRAPDTRFSLRAAVKRGRRTRCARAPTASGAMEREPRGAQHVHKPFDPLSPDERAWDRHAEP